MKNPNQMYVWVAVVWLGEEESVRGGGAQADEEDLQFSSWFFNISFSALLN